MDDSIFRKSALDKLSSPEQLDQLMQVTTPKSWLALAAGGALVLTAVFWGVFGAVHTQVAGPGILIRQGGVFVATARGNGAVKEILARAGDAVGSNQVLALIAQPELQVKIDQGTNTLKLLRQEKERIAQYQAEEIREEKQTAAEERQTYQEMIKDYSEQIAALRERILRQQEALIKRAISKVQLLETTNQLFLAEHELARTRLQLKQMDQTLLESNERRRQRLEDQTMRILEAEQDLRLNEELFRLNSEVTSPFDGYVLEIMAKAGELISASTPILSLQSKSQALQARVFVSSADGKKVRPGMAVAVSPASVKKEQYGFVLGTVTHVSEFPTTPQGMLALLENPGLVNQFSENGVPIEVEVALRRLPGRADRFQWSTRRGSELRLTSGTICSATITIQTNRPIDFVLPVFKNAAGL